MSGALCLFPVYFRLCNNNNCGVFIERSAGWPEQGAIYTYAYETPSFLGPINRIDIIITGSDMLGIDWVKVYNGDASIVSFDYGKWYMEYTGSSPTGCQVTTISEPNTWNYAGYDQCIYNDLLHVTYSPTSDPTNYPTSGPTQSPSLPTLHPTAVPTAAPSQSPTFEPTYFPSKSPTFEPTKFPTNEPTIPTLYPSVDPTMEPTFEPTFNPTKNPSSQPTSPTNVPTVSPVTDGVVSSSTTKVMTPSPTSFIGNLDVHESGSETLNGIWTMTNIILWAAGILGLLFLVTLCILIWYCWSKNGYLTSSTPQKESTGEVEFIATATPFTSIPIASPLSVFNGEQYVDYVLDQAVAPSVCSIYIEMNSTS